MYSPAYIQLLNFAKIFPMSDLAISMADLISLNIAWNVLCILLYVVNEPKHVLIGGAMAKEALPGSLKDRYIKPLASDGVDKDRKWLQSHLKTLSLKCR